MRTEKVKIWGKEEYRYKLGFDFIPNIVSYLHEDNKIRPCMLIVPGGGYGAVSSSEGEIVALEFYSRGYNTFVLTYTTNLSMKAPLRTQPMEDLSRAIRLIRKRCGLYNIDPEKIVVCGFSAGGHLCGSVCVHYMDIKEENSEYAGISNRPDAAILSYPVITAGEKANRDSFIALLGNEASQEELDYMSLEKHVHKDTPPCFLWQTATDELVPIENTYMFAQACQEKQIPYTCHIFSKGIHGLSLANGIWASGAYGGNYTFELTEKLLEAARAGEVEIDLDWLNMISHMVEPCHDSEVGVKEAMLIEREPNAEVAIWPELADIWLREQLV